MQKASTPNRLFGLFVVVLVLGLVLVGIAHRLGLITAKMGIAGQLLSAWVLCIGTVIALHQYLHERLDRSRSRAQNLISRFNSPEFAEVKSRAAKGYRHFLRGKHFRFEKMMDEEKKRRGLQDFCPENHILADGREDFSALCALYRLDETELTSELIDEAEQSLYDIWTVLNFMTEVGHAYLVGDADPTRTYMYFCDMSVQMWRDYECFIWMMRATGKQSRLDYYFSDFEDMVQDFESMSKNKREHIERDVALGKDGLQRWLERRYSEERKH